MKRRIAALMFVLAAMPWSEAARSADLVVVEAHGIALKSGQVVSDAEPLVLAEGQRVTLLAEDGNLIKLRGPFAAKPVGGGQDDAGVARSLKGLLARDDVRTNELGVVRGGGQRVKLPEPWLVAIEQPGTFCIREGDPVVLWRSTATKEGDLAVFALDRSWKMTATWPRGADRLTVLDVLVPQRKTTYLVALDGNREAITLNNIPAAVHTDKMRAAWMIEKGCRAQAEALLRTLR